MAELALAPVFLAPGGSELADPIGVEVGLVYTLIGPDGTRAVLNDPTDRDFVGFLSGEDGVTGLERAGVRESSDLLPEADGGVHGAFRYDRLSFTLKGVLPPGGGAPDAGDVLTLEDRNLVSNPSFELATTGWGAYQNGGTGTLTRSTAISAASGGAVGVLTATSAISNLGAVQSSAPYIQAAVPGEVFTASAHFRAATTPRICGLLVAFYTGAGSFITAYGTGNAINAVGAWTRNAGTPAAAPATTAFVGLYAQVFGLANGEVHYVDALQLVRGPNALGYFDGSTDADGLPYRTAWDGAEHLSPSSRYLVTRGPGSEQREWVTRQARLMRATDAMRADSRLLWTPTDAPPVQVSFRQQQPTRLTGRRPKLFLVTGVSERNVVESQELRSETLEPGAFTVGGMSSPLTSELGSDASTAGALEVTTRGQSEAWPVITFTGPMVNPSLESQTLGLGLHLNYELAAGEQLVLDSDPRRRTVRLNDEANRYSALDYLASSWFPLVPGVNELALGAFSYSAGSSVAVAWRDAWG